MGGKYHLQLVACCWDHIKSLWLLSGKSYHLFPNVHHVPNLPWIHYQATSCSPPFCIVLPTAIQYHCDTLSGFHDLTK